MNINNFKCELKALLKKYNVHIGVDIEGDTHGIETRFIVCENSNDNEHVLAYYTAYIDASDIE